MTDKQTNRHTDRQPIPNSVNPVEESDAAIMKQFKNTPYWRIFKTYIEKELDDIEEAGRTPGQGIDDIKVSKMELLRFQRIFIKGLLNLPEKIVGMNITSELQEQEVINERMIRELSI